MRYVAAGVIADIRPELQSHSCLMKITKMKHLQNTYPLIGGQRLAKECSSKKLGFWEERDFLLKAPAKSPLFVER